MYSLHCINQYLFYTMQNNLLLSGILFAVLLNFKHIYLYMAPAYFVYLLKSYCYIQVGPGKSMIYILFDCIILKYTSHDIFTSKVYSTWQFSYCCIPFVFWTIHLFWSNTQCTSATLSVHSRAMSCLLGT